MTTNTSDHIDYKKIPLVFNVYKPVGPSSFSVVQHFKRNLSYDYGKIGHFGTLDPFAEGVLLIGVQGAQKMNNYIHDLLPKTYRAVGCFGIKTDSGDSETAVVGEKHIDEIYQKLSREELEEKLAKHFLGEYWQAPHKYSASKFEGKRMYDLALKGREVVKEKVKREILDFKILNYVYPTCEMSVTVSSGTYIRSLFEEISTLLGGYGYLKVLERTAIGENLSTYAIQKEDWPLRNEPFDLEKWGTPLDHALRLDNIILDSEQTKTYLRGHRYHLNEIKKVSNDHHEDVVSDELYWVYNDNNHLLGLAQPVGEELHSLFNLREAVETFIPESVCYK